MKQISILALLVVALLFCTQSATAQTAFNPQGQRLFYTHTLAAGKTYANSQTDTLPSPSATVSAVALGGASAITLSLSTTDSVAADIYVGYRVRGTTSWTVGVTDSLVSTVDAGVKQEYIIRTNKTDNAEGLDLEFQVRIAFRASKNGVTAPAYRATFNWKP